MFTKFQKISFWYCTSSSVDITLRTGNAFLSPNRFLPLHPTMQKTYVFMKNYTAVGTNAKEKRLYCPTTDTNQGKKTAHTERVSHSIVVAVESFYYRYCLDIPALTQSSFKHITDTTKESQLRRRWIWKVNFLLEKGSNLTDRFLWAFSPFSVYVHTRFFYYLIFYHVSRALLLPFSDGACFAMFQ